MIFILDIRDGNSKINLTKAEPVNGIKEAGKMIKFYSISHQSREGKKHNGWVFCVDKNPSDLSLHEVMIEDGKEDITYVRVDYNYLEKFAIKGEYGRYKETAMFPDEKSILDWWKSLGSPIDARVEEYDLKISYEEVGKFLKSIPKGTLSNFSNLVTFNYGVNVGTWGTCTSLKIVDGDENEGVVELHTTGEYPQLNNMPTVVVNFKRKAKVSNGYLIPSEKFFCEFLERYNNSGKLRLSVESWQKGTMYLKNTPAVLRPEIVRLLNVGDQNVDISTPTKIKETMMKIYGVGEESLFTEVLIGEWIKRLSSEK